MEKTGMIERRTNGQSECGVSRGKGEGRQGESCLSQRGMKVWEITAVDKET